MRFHAGWARSRAGAIGLRPSPPQPPARRPHATRQAGLRHRRDGGAGGGAARAAQGVAGAPCAPLADGAPQPAAAPRWQLVPPSLAPARSHPPHPPPPLHPFPPQPLSQSIAEDLEEANAIIGGIRMPGARLAAARAPPPHPCSALRAGVSPAPSPFPLLARHLRCTPPPPRCATASPRPAPPLLPPAEGLAYVPVDPECGVVGVAAEYGIPPLVVALGASYFQRLLARNPAVRRGLDSGGGGGSAAVWACGPGRLGAAASALSLHCPGWLWNPCTPRAPLPPLSCRPDARHRHPQQLLCAQGPREICECGPPAPARALHQAVGPAPSPRATRLPPARSRCACCPPPPPPPHRS